MFRRPRPLVGRVRFIVVAIAFICIIRYMGMTKWSQNSKSTAFPDNRHPIESLIQASSVQFETLLSRQTHNLKSAAAEYRKRRGRHPPPGFNAWFEYAQERKVVMVEDFWDQIYHDLTPLWALPPQKLRREAAGFEMTINVRNGIAWAGSDWFWTKIWLNMIQTIENLLPDMDIPLNPMDEPRIVVPYEEIAKYVKAERSSRRMPPASMVKQEFTGKSFG
jgi:hypothetical protein